MIMALALKSIINYLRDSHAALMSTDRSAMGMELAFAKAVVLLTVRADGVLLPHWKITMPEASSLLTPWARLNMVGPSRLLLPQSYAALDPARLASRRRTDVMRSA